MRQMQEKQRELHIKRGKVPRVQESTSDKEDDEENEDEKSELLKFLDDTESEVDDEEEKEEKETILTLGVRWRRNKRTNKKRTIKTMGKTTYLKRQTTDPM